MSTVVIHADIARLTYVLVVVEVSVVVRIGGSPHYNLRVNVKLRLIIYLSFSV